MRDCSVQNIVYDRHCWARTKWNDDRGHMVLYNCSDLSTCGILASHHARTGLLQLSQEELRSAVHSRGESLIMLIIFSHLLSRQYELYPDSFLQRAKGIYLERRWNCTSVVFILSNLHFHPAQRVQIRRCGGFISHTGTGTTTMSFWT